tara:strand:- start:86 stop:304 length:219 start_codon:yes stop_codon:yes gene_type:complete
MCVDKIKITGCNEGSFILKEEIDAFNLFMALYNIKNLPNKHKVRYIAEIFSKNEVTKTENLYLKNRIKDIIS